MILLDGRKLSQKILGEVKREVGTLAQKLRPSQIRLRLAVVVVGHHAVIEKFIAQKKKAADEVGIDVRIYPFEESITTNDLRKRLAEIVHEKANAGVIVQLPLPERLKQQYILNSIPAEKDPDMLSSRALGVLAAGKSKILPPVAGAVKEFLEEYKIDYQNKNIVIVGAGVLVGKPVALWLLGEKATFSVIRSSTPHPEKFLQKADMIISGVGKPKFITGDMIKDGTVVIDAGTSESAGKVVGDIDFDSVAPKAAYLTPVPGGLGPVTVAILLKNLVTLSKKSK